MNSEVKELVILAADKNMEAAIQGILSRSKALGIRPIKPDIYRHPQKDTGCRTDGVDFLSAFADHYRYALLIFDFEGCGEYDIPASALEQRLRDKLCTLWHDRAEVIIIEPELDIWVWSDSPHVETVLGWADQKQAMRPWLQNLGFLPAGSIKPERPKEALEAVMMLIKKPRSSTIYSDLAKKVSFKRCTDRSFVKLTNILHAWFMEDLPDE